MQGGYIARFAVDAPLVVQGIGAAEADLAGKLRIVLADPGAVEPDRSSSKELAVQVREAIDQQAPRAR
jgi:hypothetical protein